MKKKIAFGYYGGKYSHLNWLLPLLPYTEHYCEPFGGSAAVLINRNPSPIETYNDLNGEVVNFFRQLRDNKEKLVEEIGLTPFSRDEFRIAFHGGECSDMERARRFFVLARQTRTGLSQSASEGRWAYCILSSRSGMSGAVSRWLGGVKWLSEISERLLRVQFDNDPAIKVIKRYDSVDTVFYCDPPYMHESRKDTGAYLYEMSGEDHRELSLVLHSIKGKVAVSGYKCALMEELYGDWNRVEGPTKRASSADASKGKESFCRTEGLWANYDLEGGK